MSVSYTKTIRGKIGSHRKDLELGLELPEDAEHNVEETEIEQVGGNERAEGQAHRGGNKPG